MADGQLDKTQRQLIRDVAATQGIGHQPKWYIQHIQQRHGVTVSNAQITKSIGSLWSRLTANHPYTIDLAKKLLRACGEDKGLAGFLLHKANTL